MTTQLVDDAVQLWREQPTTAPPFERSFAATEQIEREGSLDHFWQSLRGELESLPKTRDQRQAARERISSAFVTFAQDGLDYSGRHLDVLLNGGLSRVGTDLARQARAFDPQVSAADIFQATRNAWAACGLQMLLGRPMRLTPAIFAYSMLYPYSDNYLDSPTVERSDKLGFSARFGRRLAGAPVDPANAHEQAIWRLVSLIESDYDRAAAPGVYRSLLSIHQAQENSTRLLRQTVAEEEIVRLSFAKGGSSVLADGYLAAGTLTPAQQSFIFGWGVFLQLADDLQDITDDRRDGASTLFTDAATRGFLDPLVNRTLHFGVAVMAQMRALPTPGCEPLIELIQRSSWSLVIRSVAEAAPLFTAPYVEALETHSPFRFAYLRDRRTQAGRRSQLLGKLFEAFLAGEPDEPAFPLLPSSLLPRF